MIISILFLVLLFTVCVVNVFFDLPANKFYHWLQGFIFNQNKNEKPSSIYGNKNENPSELRLKDDAKREELKRVFKTFDKDGDGYITKEELRESLENVRIAATEEETEDMVAKFDQNGDGLIEFDEFCCLLREKVIHDEGGEDETLKEAFDVFDENRDGFISAEELSSVLCSLGLNEGNTFEDCKKMIMKADGDGDGRVSFVEFKRMMGSSD